MIKKRSVEVDGVKLRELREDQMLSVRELGRLADVNYATILRLENNQSGGWPRTLRKLAAALGVDPRELRRK
jgi:transcriptional regulator with XRE-family HTH domain